MKQIKTIRYKLDYSEDFDRDVNAALKEGWTLTRRAVLMPPTDDKAAMVYAELEKNVDIDWSENELEN